MWRWCEKESKVSVGGAASGREEAWRPWRRAAGTRALETRALYPACAIATG